MLNSDGIPEFPRLQKERAWRSLIAGTSLIDALWHSMRANDLAETLNRVSPWINYARGNPDQDVRWQGSVIENVCSLAEIASLGDPPPAGRDTALQALLRRIDAEVSVDDFGRLAAVADETTWRTFLRDSLYRLDWKIGHNAPWAWDILNTFMRETVTERRGFRYEGRLPDRTESISVLFVSDKGYTGRLTLDRIPEGGSGQLYPHPEMSLIPQESRMEKEASGTSGQSFEESLDNASAFVRGEGLWPVDGPDVRWHIAAHQAEHGGMHLERLEGGSAGGAFALCLAKLLSDQRT